MFFLTYKYDNGVGGTDGETMTFADDDMTGLLEYASSTHGSPILTALDEDDIDNMLTGAADAALFAAHGWDNNRDEDDQMVDVNGLAMMNTGQIDRDPVIDWLRSDFLGWVGADPIRVRAALDHLGASNDAATQLGHAWLLSAQGHGTGLWDLGLPDDIATPLHALADGIESVVINVTDPEHPELDLF